ncbi:MAG TPA: hypothetical protein VHD38_00390 [Candidatus Paceibacterota bacterium]|nr:hypothetical protein [Candidatus Paceibacterota bacterium]
MSARFTRGSSVLAALILVVLVGSIALAINTIATPGHDLALTHSQTAEVGSATDRGYGDFTSTAPQNCSEAKQAALGKVFGPDTTNIDKGQSGTVDACFGAYSTTGKPSNNPNDYQCTGRAGSADFGDGIVTVKTSVSKLAPAGKCVIAVCQNGKCAGAKAFDGVNLSKYTPDATNPTSALVQNDGTGGEYSTALSQTESGAIRDAFSNSPEVAQKALNDAQITLNNEELDQLNKYINSCESGSECPDADAAMQRASDLEKQNAALQAQSDKLATSIKTDIKPDIDPTTGLTTCKSSSCADNNQGTYGQANSFGKPSSPDIDPTTGQTTCKSASCVDNNQKVYTPPGGSGQQPGGSQQQPEQQGGGLGSLLQSMLGGLAKALGGAAGGAGGSGSCTTDQNQYQQQQQQYQQQMTLYNQQLQQYNYQVQIAQMQGYPPPPQPTPPQQPCFNQSSTPVQCTTSPAQPAASGCANGTWKPTTQSGNSCISGWQCVPTGTGTGGTPTAQLSCQPQVADVGMSIAISFSCGNATGSAGQGFDTGNKLSGSATSTISNPPAGATKATFGLQCVNGSVPATASCSVDISKPSIILVANPKVIPVNASSTIGWLTTGMQSCVVSSPDVPEFTAQNALNTSVNGMAITPALTQTSTFLLHCTTQGGQTKDATTTVQVGAPSNDSGGGVSVSSSAEGNSINRGDTMAVSWQSASTSPAAAEIDLWLYDVALDAPTALIKTGLNPTSTYNWKLPLASDTCDTTKPNVCGIDLVPGREYAIEAVLYPNSDPNAQYIDYGFTQDTFTIGN